MRGGARGVAYRGGVYRRGVGVGAAAVGAAAAGAAATGAYYSGYGPLSYGGYGPSSGYGGYGASTVGVPGTASAQRPTFEEAWKICTPYAQQIGDWNVQGRTARGKSCMLRYGYTI